MNLHEYQTKHLFSQYKIPILEGVTISQLDELDVAADKLGGDAWVVKAQVHAGGRGKAGGVKLVKGRDELMAASEALLGKQLVTHQTGSEGLPINTLLLESLTEIDRELYLSLVVDRARQCIVVMVSVAGGMDIEAVAATEPEKILTAMIDPAAGYQAYIGRKLAYGLELEGVQVKQFVQILGALVKLFQEQDAALLEINPLIITQQGDLLALDAKLNLDGSALYRHPDLREMRDITQEDEREARAAEHELNYIHLDGNIGCMVNGAGLAMATMDLIKLNGGQPANFLDVGGGTTAERVAEAFKIILSDPAVKGILVNIFGGIVRCDLIAEGIIKAVAENGITVPVVVRLEGTNVEQGRKKLVESGLNIISAGGLTEAAEKVIAAAGENA
ncbi:MAG TPA: ADP-forming succinate--CoA ligase subunit beta [Thiotrichaceae bacterium]|nr:ADP-forming succinate--CoA ligase subunit beta [Thiotrichaceae bacterium]